MEPQNLASSQALLVVALNELRDCLVILSTDLEDYLADIPSPERDEAMLMVEQYIDRSGAS